MSILSALKKKFNAKGNNIEEAIKTMEVGGGGSSEPGVVVCRYDYSDDEEKYICRKTVQEIKSLINTGTTVLMSEDGLNTNIAMVSLYNGHDAIKWNSMHCNLNLTNKKIQEIVYTENIYTDEDGFTFISYNKYF